VSNELVGVLDTAGEIRLDGREPVSGLIITIGREALRAAPTLPMLKQVAVLPVEELAALRDRAEKAEALAADKERLDWCEQGGWALLLTREDQTLREAIDEAISDQEGGAK